MGQRILLAASLLLNASFIAWILWRTQTEVPVEGPTLEPPLQITEEPVEEDEPQPEPEPPAPPSWSDVADEDFMKYRANLAELGVPESLSQSIIRAAITRNLRDRLAHADFSDSALCPLPLHSDWSPIPGAEPALDALRAYRSESRRLGIPLDEPNPLEDLDVTQAPLAFLPGKARQLLANFEARIETKRQSQPAKPADSRIAELEKDRDAALKEILSAADFDEYRLRTSPYARLPRMVRAVDLTADDMRAITRIYTESSAAGTPRNEASADRLMKLLGKERFAAWQRAVGTPGR